MTGEATIAAPGTALLPSARGVVRVSGPDCFTVLERILTRRLPRRAGAQPLELKLCDGVPALQAWGLVFVAPRSYTGEDLIELHLPGGPVLLQTALDRLLAAGAVLAGPGELTRRAFLHGKLQLHEAEAIGALVAARAERERRQAWDLAHSGLAAEIESLRGPLFQLLCHIEAELDFSHHEIELLADERARSVLLRARRRVGELLRRERACLPLARVCLEGPPNAGKSSLFNALLGEERALTSARAGTTLDVVEEALQLPSLRVLLQDLAGWQSGSAAWEEARARARACVEAAELVVSVRPVGSSEPFHDGALAVTSKLDLAPEAARPGSFGVSAATGVGLDTLRGAIEGRVAEACAGGRVLQRHREQLTRATEALDSGLGALEAGLGAACLALDLRVAVQSLGALSGQDFAEDLLDRIFAGFCIGK